MKVLLVNAGPHPAGCTAAALDEVAETLRGEGIETETVWAGRVSTGCMACGGCATADRCAFDGDPVNEIIEKAKGCDGFVFGTPVHYAGASGAATALLDRCFYAGGAAFRHKPGAAVVSARRSGCTAAFDQINKYFTINQMPIVSSRYWNNVHGNTPEEVRQDREGLQTMRFLARNMAWLLRCIEAGKARGIEPPEQEPVVKTNFIR